ncbi:Tyramine beta-hydroxylase [Aphelenchoides besseyi]|nr:Tyramine beta-hydroxylase [Aphelenchoides besseyi]
MANLWFVVGFAILIGWSIVHGDRSREMIVKLKKTKLMVSWNVDWELQEVEIDVHYSGRRPAWILVGFSDHGKIEGSDGCLYAGNQNVLDVHLLANGRIQTDRHQDCRILRSNPKNMHFRFIRKFSTCDPRDYAIEIRRTFQ